jgi:tRNA(Ile)-lysidine synthase
MVRSHPPALLTIVERTLREECALPKGARVLVAVSGGGDSMALLDVLCRLAGRLGLVLHAHGVDHGLRPEAGAELDLAADLARAHGVPFTCSRVTVARRGNLQSRAREARFEALWSAAEAANAEWLATAHHADDRAETVLMRLLRGAGPGGLAVLSPRQGRMLRPLIRARKRDVVAHLERHRLPFASDPSNRDRRYLRVRVREELIPLLETLEPQVVRHLNALADQLGIGQGPLVLDGAGRRVALNRAQVTAIRHAQLHRRYSARIRLPGGREIVIDRDTGEPTLRE